MTDLRIGAPFSWRPSAFASKCDNDERQKPVLHGRIIFINREHGYFTAEATCNGYTIRESFCAAAHRKAIERAG